jgi:hypothetical protein
VLAWFEKGAVDGRTAAPEPSADSDASNESVEPIAPIVTLYIQMEVLWMRGGPYRFLLTLRIIAVSGILTRLLASTQASRPKVDPCTRCLQAG